MNFKECYKGFLQSNGKAPTVPRKGKKVNYLDYDTAKTCNEFVGVLADNTILVDVDNEDQGKLLKGILKELDIKCPVLRTTKGYHFLFKHNTKAYKSKMIGAKLPIGITADIILGAHNGVQCLKLGRIERDILNDPNYAEIPEIPKFLYTPTKNAFKNLDIIEILLKNGAKTNIKNEFGYDAKHYTSEEYHDKKKSKEIRNLMGYYKQ